MSHYSFNNESTLTTFPTSASYSKNEMKNKPMFGYTSNDSLTTFSTGIPQHQSHNDSTLTTFDTAVNPSFGTNQRQSSSHATHKTKCEYCNGSGEYTSSLTW